ncbi:hypothetical protein CRE_02598 [Caenorhabditis remanei]|uniref:Uncharacterized protein n=1 Tax=Caenorhabditis remanei TaxID=31234 RepID=E3N9V3_CAERE|nr:hypothetical protein CRE_02598 [Caenorhabditis remanei]
MRFPSIFTIALLVSIYSGNNFKENPFSKPDINFIIPPSPSQFLLFGLYFIIMAVKFLYAQEHDEEPGRERTVQRWTTISIVFGMIVSIYICCLPYLVDFRSTTFSCIFYFTLIFFTIFYGLMTTEYIIIQVYYDLWIFPVALLALLSCIYASLIVPKSLHFHISACICCVLFGIHEIVSIWKHGLNKRMWDCIYEDWEAENGPVQPVIFLK